MQTGRVSRETNSNTGVGGEPSVDPVERLFGKLEVGN